MVSNCPSEGLSEVTSVSKKSGQTIVVIQYYSLSRFFWNRRYRNAVDTLFDNYLPGFSENFLRTLDSNETWTKDMVHQSLIFWHWLDTQEIRNWITYNLPPISSPLIELNFHIFSVEQWVYKFPLAENCPLIIQGSFQHQMFFDDQNIHSNILENL